MKLKQVDTLEGLFKIMNVEKAHENSTKGFDLHNLKTMTSEFSQSDFKRHQDSDIKSKDSPKLGRL